MIVFLCENSQLPLAVKYFHKKSSIIDDWQVPKYAFQIVSRWNVRKFSLKTSVE